MSNYIKSTDFASKDALLTGNPLKTIKGTEIDDEFNSIQTAVNTKADSNDAELTGTPTAPTAPEGTNTTQVATTAFVITNGVPAGGIIMWSGSVASIPSGFALCDGTNSTPDLRNRFIVGAGDTYAVDATGGSADATLVSHSHTATSTVTDPGHSHDGEYYRPDLSGGGNVTGGAFDTNEPMPTATTGITVATSISTEGSSATNANLPPYYALAYIMKL